MFGDLCNIRYFTINSKRDELNVCGKIGLQSTQAPVEIIKRVVAVYRRV